MCNSILKCKIPIQKTETKGKKIKKKKGRTWTNYVVKTCNLWTHSGSNVHTALFRVKNESLQCVNVGGDHVLSKS